MNSFTDLSLLIELLKPLLTAALLGAMLALHPVRLMGRWGKKVDWATAQAQVLVTVAGALAVIMIGDNMARAFGLVGLGSLIRFRAEMENPRDGAILLLLLGIGMACGVQLYAVAAVATAFVFVLIFVLALRPFEAKKKNKVNPEGIA